MKFVDIPKEIVSNYGLDDFGSVAEYIEEFGIDINDIENSILEVEKGSIIEGGSPELLIKKVDGDWSITDDGLTWTPKHEEEVLAILIAFSADNGLVSNYLKK